MSSSTILYWGSGSIPCWRPLLVLAEKGIDYTSKLIEFGKKEHKSEEIMKINPRGQVPTFKDGDIVINESLGIIDYLETTYKDKGTVLIPEGAAARASVLQKKFEALNLQKIIDSLIYYRWFTKKEDVSQAKLDEGVENARKELSVWEGYLSKGGDYIAGSSFSMADIMLFTYIAFFWRMGLDLEKYPNINAYFNKHKDRPSVQSTWPPHWKTSDNQTLLSSI